MAYHNGSCQGRNDHHLRVTPCPCCPDYVGPWACNVCHGGLPERVPLRVRREREQLSAKAGSEPSKGQEVVEGKTESTYHFSLRSTYGDDAVPGSPFAAASSSQEIPIGSEPKAAPPGLGYKAVQHKSKANTKAGTSVEPSAAGSKGHSGSKPSVQQVQSKKGPPSIPVAETSDDEPASSSATHEINASDVTVEVLRRIQNGEEIIVNF